MHCQALGFLLLLSFLSFCCASPPAADANATRRAIKFTLTAYGQWCGSGHGGFQDCCENRGCSACVAGLDQDPMTLSDECLAQCPPIDLLDEACAWHDLCVFQSDISVISDSPNFCAKPWAPANQCYCDCQLVKEMDQTMCPPYDQLCSNYKSRAMLYFNNFGGCFYADENNQLVCDHNLPLNAFC